MMAANASPLTDTSVGPAMDPNAYFYYNSLHQNMLKIVILHNNIALLFRSMRGTHNTPRPVRQSGSQLKWSIPRDNASHGSM